MGAVVIFLFSFFLMGMLGSAFFPDTDRNEFTIEVKAAPGSSLEQTSLICEQVEAILNKRSEVITILTTIGGANDPVTRGTVLAKLVNKREREKSDKKIINELRNDLKYLPGADFSFLLQGGPGGNEKPVSLSVRGEDIAQLTKLAEKIELIVKSTKGTVDVDNSLEISKPEVRVILDREKASDLGVNPYLVASSVRAMVDGYVATKFQQGDEQYDVRVRLQKSDRTKLSDINLLTFKSNKNKPDGGKFIVALGDFATVQEGTGPSQINRYAKQKEIRVAANLSGRLLGEVLGDINKKIESVKFEPGYSVKVVGQGEMQAESFANMLLSLALAIIFVYIVLAAQFDSFVHPFSIMLALPMSIIGAVIFLLIFGSSMSVISIIGIIMLMGLVTKNGILLVDYTNVLRERGLSRFDALVKAGPTRLRPILMTSFAMIFGMMPVALALGEGSEFRSPMGQAVIGGLITSTLLTLFIVPVVYSILDDFSFTKLVAFFGKILPLKKNKVSSEFLDKNRQPQLNK
jgi:HAE1 family hydrophobic/amphiphilic exporter-1